MVQPEKPYRRGMVVFAHADRIVVLNRGAVIAEGTADSIRADPTVRAVYLGGGTPESVTEQVPPNA